MASRREIKLSETWKPTSLIAVINMRKDLSDADKVRNTLKVQGDTSPRLLFCVALNLGVPQAGLALLQLATAHAG